MTWGVRHPALALASAPAAPHAFARSWRSSACVVQQIPDSRECPASGGVALPLSRACGRGSLPAKPITKQLVQCSWTTFLDITAWMHGCTVKMHVHPCRLSRNIVRFLRALILAGASVHVRCNTWLAGAAPCSTRAHKSPTLLLKPVRTGPPCISARRSGRCSWPWETRYPWNRASRLRYWKSSLPAWVTELTDGAATCPSGPTRRYALKPLVPICPECVLSTHFIQYRWHECSFAVAATAGASTLERPPLAPSAHCFILARMLPWSC